MHKPSLALALALALAATLAPAEEPVPAAGPGSAPAAAQSPVSDAERKRQALAWAKALWASLDRRHGTIELPGGVATLNVPESFYYLNPADAKKVLVEVWGNPPGSAEGILGMLFPADTTPFDRGAWGVTIAYEEEGYVSDKDADAIDYDTLLNQMREAARASNKQRLAAGYEPIELIGWAAKPYYDQASRKLHWAKEIRIGDQPEHTLNYAIRVLGRKGVLDLNFVAGMDQKDLVAGQLDKVLAMAEFKTGSRYEDFIPGMDKVAAYGLGALVAGKVLAKTGFLVVALLFLKKFGVLAVAALGALGAKLWRRGKKTV